ncbi:TPA: hypothetical protein N0F65_002917 [Lagenidium giganteum]|uniref:RBR-type E3 ubiquitin transferase n=1 Tax=Lagenidium giganteum TaxID=4803 RepID=A0AAV2Z685_9STRA|nr:TPA: hypothetical protein N0F65_002917 [Lagenidium giganteum]
MNAQDEVSWFSHLPDDQRTGDPPDVSMLKPFNSFLHAVQVGAWLTDVEYDTALRQLALAERGTATTHSFLMCLRQRVDKRPNFANIGERERWQWLVSKLRDQRDTAAKASPWPSNTSFLLDGIVHLVRQRRVQRSVASTANSHLTDEVRLSVLEAGQMPTQVDDRTNMNDADRRQWSSIARYMRGTSGRRVPRSRQKGSDSSVASSFSSLRDSEISVVSSVEASRYFVLSFSSLLGFGMDETFYCQICFEHVAVANAYVLSACGHQFCATCLQSYLESKINDGQIRPLCFYESTDMPTTASSSCGCDIVDTDIQQLTSPTCWRRLTRFRFNQAHKNARQCPYCNHSQVCPGGEAAPACVCESCGQEFCFVHSSAHQGRSCAQSEKKLAALEKINRSLINRISKPCSGCGNPVQKCGGCNHMTCILCHTDFCWLCLSIVDTSVYPEHFEWWNVGGCPGAQMANDDNDSACLRYTSRAFRFVYVAVFAPPALIIAWVPTLLTWPLPVVRARFGTMRAAYSWWLRHSMYLMVSPLVLVVGAIIVACALVCAPFVGVLLLLDYCEIITL